MAVATAEETQNKVDLTAGQRGSRQAQEKSPETPPAKDQKLDTLGYSFFFLLACFAVFIDILPFVTAGFSALADWLLDLGFWFAVTVIVAIVTGDVMGSLTSKRGAVNILQTIAEFIPVIDFLPFHTVAIVIIFLDIQYNVISKVTGLATGKSKKISKIASKFKSKS